MIHTTKKRYKHVLPLLLYASLLGLYYVARYKALWTESDTSSITKTIEVIMLQGTLTPSVSAYWHGFNYQASTYFLSLLTGVSIQTLQVVLWPILAPVILALIGFLFYRQILRESQVAFLAGLMLFFQPDLLFVILRGSHEKLDWPLMIVAMTLLVKSIDKPIRKMFVYIIFFYLIIFGMITTNVFFGTTFVVSVAISLILGRSIDLFLRRRFSAGTDLNRLLYILLSCSIIIFIFIFYLYPPALRNIKELRNIIEQISALFLNFEPEGQPYQNISVGWISPLTYFGLSLFTWVMIASSFLVWLWRGNQILKKEQPFILKYNLDWLLYAGFAIQVALSIIVDYSGVLGENLQLRIFPGFTIMAVALLSQGIKNVYSISNRNRTIRSLILGLGIVATIWFSIASILKANTEPILSNKWIFYSPSEVASVAWSEKNIYWSTIWSGNDERIRELYRLMYATQSRSYNFFSDSRLEYAYRYILFSEREFLRGLRIHVAMPPVSDWNRIYDNGDVYFYHRLPRTPFQK